MKHENYYLLGSNILQFGDSPSRGYEQSQIKLILRTPTKSLSKITNPNISLEVTKKIPNLTAWSTTRQQKFKYLLNLIRNELIQLFRFSLMFRLWTSGLGPSSQLNLNNNTACSWQLLGTTSRLLFTQPRKSPSQF